MSGLPKKIISIHKALAKADIPHAFGGALALAWCTLQARGTVDIDVNIFVDVDTAEQAFKALPKGITRAEKDLKAVVNEGQVRLWWDNTPVDIFLNTTDFHKQASQRVRWEQFAGIETPFLACQDIAVFKAFFNRSRDWADLEEMRDANTLDIEQVIGVLATYLGNDDERIDRLRALQTRKTYN